MGRQGVSECGSECPTSQNPLNPQNSKACQPKTLKTLSLCNLKHLQLLEVDIGSLESSLRVNSTLRRLDLQASQLKLRV